mgnify:FL=1
MTAGTLVRDFHRKPTAKRREQIEDVLAGPEGLVRPPTPRQVRI